jgi:uncharacterized circularly permuted ATP-grasp superfamily protein/uncharacterized alpha-E superfamily protein
MSDRVDEMVDGAGRIRPHWRGLLSAFSGLGEGGLREYVHRLDRAFEDEGVTSILPGGKEHVWRCDPVPLPITAAEFAVLEAGLAQRARLLDAVLADIYGPQTLLADGVLPPAVVYANAAFLRPCCNLPGRHHLDFYAADLVRGPDGAWRVIADRTAAAGGLAYARENRRVLARVLPEAFRGVPVRALRPFFDTWQDALQRLAPPRGAGAPGNPSVALLTPGTGSPQWFEHMYLARELSSALVEGWDLTVRGGAVFLKTLQGLQPVDVLLRWLDGRMIDPLELEAASMLGVAGLMDAARMGTVRITNHPGTGAAEAPALAAWLEALSLRLLGEKLLLASVPTLWLGDADARRRVHEHPGRWLIRSATDGRAAGRALAGLAADQRADLLGQIARHGWDFAACLAIPPSLAPCAGKRGLEPLPVVLRLFLVHDGAAWRAMEGGLARVVEGADSLVGLMQSMGPSKDVWVLNDDRSDIIGPAAVPAPPLQIRRSTGELPSRVADDLFWLGRYVERLEAAARLIRAALGRVSRNTLLPREYVELTVLTNCLAHAGLIPSEAAGTVGVSAVLTDALLVTAREAGPLEHLFNRTARLTEVVRDRLTGDMYAGFTHALRLALADTQAARRSLDQLVHAMVSIIRFSTVVAGAAAENMVRGGGWLFLDLGRRIERAEAVTANVAFALDQPPARVEAGLRLSLELCDSVITYRTRYLNVLQPAPVLDLVLADEGNPRGLAFQLEAIWHLLDQISGRSDSFLPAAAAALLAEAGLLVQGIVGAADQAIEATRLPPRLRELEAGVAALSDRIGRHYFAMLPTPQTVGMDGEATALEGAA